MVYLSSFFINCSATSFAHKPVYGFFAISFKYSFHEIPVALLQSSYFWTTLLYAFSCSSQYFSTASLLQTLHFTTFPPLFLQRTIRIEAQPPRSPTPNLHPHKRPTAGTTILSHGFGCSLLGKGKRRGANAFEVVGAADEALSSLS